MVLLKSNYGSLNLKARDSRRLSLHAPLVVATPRGKSEVVAACIKQVFAFDADSGAPRWTCQTGIGWYVCPTPVAKDGIVYAIGGHNPQNGLACSPTIILPPWE